MHNLPFGIALPIALYAALHAYSLVFSFLFPLFKDCIITGPPVRFCISALVLGLVHTLSHPMVFFKAASIDFIDRICSTTHSASFDPIPIRLSAFLEPHPRWQWLDVALLDWTHAHPSSSPVN